ncbi:hypothetical protein H4219_002458 [Mycoemilia scoparia]|uniref:EF-hand domain-containing protein n=1 Tax=Mycoemilia scoparia TaxID=417184 RepID=A0A9W8A383_9FUNG|nr:hypothetical protein H4219_002458 [Mycoemilia scoparia]
MSEMLPERYGDELGKSDYRSNRPRPTHYQGDNNAIMNDRTINPDNTHINNGNSMITASGYYGNSRANRSTNRQQQYQPKGLATTLSAEKKEEIQEAFEIFDQSGTGFIPTRALKLAFKALGWDEIDQKTLHQWTTQIDPDHKGKISFEIFNEFVAEKISSQDPDQEIIRAFKLFKKDKSSMPNDAITINDLRRVANELGEQVSDDDLREMLEVADTKGDGVVRIEDFIRIMNKTGLF